MGTYIIIFLIVVIAFLIYKLYGAIALCNYNNEKYAKWEHEYWMLRTSDAIDKDYEIHISWIPRGEDGCIFKKN